MTPTSEAVFNAALALPAEERAALAEQLLDSLNPPTDQEEINRAWVEEVDRRLRAYREGKTKAVPAEEVFRELQRRKTP